MRHLYKQHPAYSDPEFWCDVEFPPDTPTDDVAECDCLPCLQAAVDFGAAARKRIEVLSREQPPWMRR